MDGDGDDHGGAPADRAELSRAAIPGRRRERLSDLPNDILVSILVRLNFLDSADATRTSILSSRWRRLWAQLPALSFLCRTPDCTRVHAGLAARARVSQDIARLIVIFWTAAAPDDATSWLRIAARLVSGELYFYYRVEVGDDGQERELDAVVMVERGAFELPCFKKANKIYLDLGFLGLALPSPGAFDALRVLRLQNFQSQGQFSLDDTFCPSLQELYLRKARGLVDLELSSTSLVRVYLVEVRSLQRLSVVTPGLKVLNVLHCLYDVLAPIANIVAERLEEFWWIAFYDPTSVSLSEMPCLLLLIPPPIFPYRPHETELNQDCMNFLKRFPAVDHLILEMVIEPDEDSLLLLMEDITNFPDIKILSLLVQTNGHVFGASVLPLLMLCTGIRQLNLKFKGEMEVHNACSPNCICDQPSSWRAQDISMKALEVVKILNLRGAEHEVDFVKLLFRTAPALKWMGITWHSSLAGSEKLHEDSQSISRLCPEACLLQFY